MTLIPQPQAGLALARLLQVASSSWWPEMHSLYQRPASPDCLLVSNCPENSRDVSEHAAARQVISQWVPQRWGPAWRMEPKVACTGTWCFPVVDFYLDTGLDWDSDGLSVPPFSSLLLDDTLRVPEYLC